MFYEEFRLARIAAAAGWSVSLTPHCLPITTSATLTESGSMTSRPTPQDASILVVSAGVFVVHPPANQGKNPILKFGRHNYGYVTEVRVGESDDTEVSERMVSSPKRDGNNATSEYLSGDANEDLREGIRQLAPEFASGPLGQSAVVLVLQRPRG
ncbi:fructosyl amino acid [Colletotrichum truncatum]|uniref:Fructosyl amino acid n=1 Tax=Colletotrichum truncatum TaxID=5467 RepID=A0ACC3YPJ1_COLTU|nr:fructosyl amino acid [Colletotrichum truncatum]KAF6784215.1 fructosyl amino acid [Colletotrichum truncatum]